MRTIISHTDEVDSATAAQELVRQADAQLDGERPRGGLLYTTLEYDAPTLLQEIRSRWPDLPLIGATTAGEVSSKLGYRADSACLTLFVGDDLDVVAGRGIDPSGDLEGAVAAALAALGDRRPALGIVHCPGTVGNASAVLETLHRRMGNRACPIVGGLAGDHTVSANTRQFFGDQVDYDSLSVLFLCGDLQVSWGVASGWFPIGTRHVVTRSVGNKIFEIDGRPAVDIYQSFWGDKVAANLGEFPLAVSVGAEANDFMLRAAMAIDEAEGSIAFAGDVPQGATVSLTEVVPEGLLSGTETSVRRAVAGYRGSQPSIALLFTCAARKWVLGRNAEAEITKLASSFGAMGLPSVDFAGFYAFGEICPAPAGGPALLHNETCVTVLVGR